MYAQMINQSLTFMYESATHKTFVSFSNSLEAHSIQAYVNSINRIKSRFSWRSCCNFKKSTSRYSDYSRKRTFLESEHTFFKRYLWQDARSCSIVVAVIRLCLYVASWFTHHRSECPILWSGRIEWRSPYDGLERCSMLWNCLVARQCLCIANIWTRITLWRSIVSLRLKNKCKERYGHPKLHHIQYSGRKRLFVDIFWQRSRSLFFLRVK